MGNKSYKFIEKRRRVLQTTGLDLRGARKHLKITQKELADYIGISQNVLSKFETGKLDSLSIMVIAVEYLNTVINENESN